MSSAEAYSGACGAPIAPGHGSSHLDFLPWIGLAIEVDWISSKICGLPINSVVVVVMHVRECATLDDYDRCRIVEI